MTDQIIDNAIQEVLTTEPETTTEVSTETPEVESTEPVEVVEEVPADEPQAAAEEAVEFPKKAVNAISRRDKKINKLQAQHNELQQQLAALQGTQAAQPETQQANGRPNEEDFETYGDFLKADLMHDIKSEQGVEKQKAHEQQLSTQEQQWVGQRREGLAEQAEAVAQDFPDFGQVWSENADILNDLPKHVEYAFYESDNAAMAIYSLAKDGKLEDLASMSPTKAVMEIGRAQVRSKPKLTSNAPAPIKGVKGSTKNETSLNEKSASDLLKWLDN